MKFKNFYKTMNESAKSKFEKDLKKAQEHIEFTYNIMVLGKEMYAVIHPYYTENRRARNYFQREGYEFGNSGKDFFQVYPKK